MEREREGERETIIYMERGTDKIQIRMETNKTMRRGEEKREGERERESECACLRVKRARRSSFLSRFRKTKETQITQNESSGGPPLKQNCAMQRCRNATKSRIQKNITKTQSENHIPAMQLQTVCG